jgi:hypothetical protein
MEFGSHDVTSMRALLAKTSLLGQPKWAAATRGDGPAAVAVAVSFIPVDKITLSFDLAMTALVACAIEGDAGAQIIVANILFHLRGAAAGHQQIATSWFTSNPAAAGVSGKRRGETAEVPLTNGLKRIEPSKSEAMVPKAHELWRTIPANEINGSRRLAVDEYVAESLTRINMKPWVAAAAGDVLCAIRLAREVEIPKDEFTRPVDDRLTLLLYCALKGSAEAALVLSSLLRRMPLKATVKKRLVASWLVRGRQIDDFGEPDVTPRRSHLRLVPKLLGGQEEES